MRDLFTEAFLCSISFSVDHDQDTHATAGLKFCARLANSKIAT